MNLGFNDKEQLLDIATLGAEHQIQRPNLVTRMTACGEFTRLGSQVKLSKTPEFWTDPILMPMGSSRPEWLPTRDDVSRRERAAPAARNAMKDHAAR
jgi:hypothetical protein